MKYDLKTKELRAIGIVAVVWLCRLLTGYIETDVWLYSMGFLAILAVAAILKQKKGA